MSVAEVVEGLTIPGNGDRRQGRSGSLFQNGRAGSYRRGKQRCGKSSDGGLLHHLAQFGFETENWGIKKRERSIKRNITSVYQARGLTRESTEARRRVKKRRREKLLWRFEVCGGSLGL